MNVGTYELIGRVAASRRGAVWKGRDPQLDRDVALKQVVAPSPETARQLHAEAAVMGGLHHPNIVAVYDLLESDGDLWLAEEWVDGADLAAVSAESGRLSVAQALGVVHGALDGLAYVHARGVVHGDVAPGNIVVSVDGVSKLADFGLAGASGGPSVGGTPGFASPEALAGAPLAPTMDVYAAAAVIAAVLRGDSLAGSSGGATDLLRGVPGGVAPVLRTALATDPSQRYPDAAALLAAFDEAAERTFGAGWWTTAGVGAAAAATTSGGIAAVGAAAAGAGAVGLENAAAPIQTSVTTAQVASAGAKVATRSARVPLIVGGAVVTALAVVVAGFAVVRHGSGTSAGPVAGPSVSGAADAGYQPAGASPTPGATPTPTPAPNPAEGFNGKYRYTSVVVSSTDPSLKVGKKYTTTWKIHTTCDPDCTAAVTSAKSSHFNFLADGGGWSYQDVVKVACVNSKTGKPTGAKVKFKDQASMRPSKLEDGIVVEMSGSSRYRQLQLCAHQEAARFDTKYKLTLTLLKQ